MTRPGGEATDEDNALVARATRIMLERTARTIGTEFFKAMARAIAETLGTRYGFVGELVDPDTRTIRTLAIWQGDRYLENFEYSLVGTPCANVMAGELCHYQDDVTVTFPDDTMLVDMGIKSYLGLPIGARDASSLGLVVALHDRSTPPVPELAGVLSLFADRAGAELERIRSDEERRRSEARYRQIVTTCNEGVWMIDTAATTTFVNAQMAAILGRSEAEMLGRPLFDFMDDAGRAIAGDLLAQRANGAAAVHDFRFVHALGHDVWTTIAANPLYDDAGQYSGALALVTDITDRRAREAAAHQAQRLESLGVLAGGIAHDFNNLLVGILGNAELALRDASQVPVALADIRAAADRARELTRQLLAFAGKRGFVTEPVDLNHAVSELAQLLSTAISKKAKLRFELTNDRVVVEADPSQLGQVIMNLITNASDALGDQPGTITITTSVLVLDAGDLARMFIGAGLAAGEYVCLEVQDTGCGMDDATRARIFEPFFTTKLTGRGLGLATVAGVVRSHRGAARVDSNVGGGTTFTILFPRAAVATVRAPAVATSAARLDGRVIILADDEPLIRALVVRALSAEGCKVLAAANGAEAIAMVRAHPEVIDLVLLDVTMPDLSGPEVYQVLRRERPELRILFTSGYAADDVMRAVKDSRTGFLAKPWTVHALLDQIGEALSD